MTDQLDPQFEIFSEMLDNEDSLGESSRSLMGQDGALLLKLREQLRGEAAAPPLPEDFAKRTAGAVQERFASMPVLTRGLVSWEPTLRANPFSKAGLPWLFAASLLGLSAAAISLKALGLLGLLVLLPTLGLSFLLGHRLPQSLILPEAVPVTAETDRPALSGLFYLIPSLALLATSGLAAAGVKGLGELSLSFQANGRNLELAGLATVLVVFAWLYNTCWPLWKAYEQATRGRTVRTLVFQSLHALWIMLVLAIVLDPNRLGLEVVSGRPLLEMSNWRWQELAVIGWLPLSLVVTAVLTRRQASATTSQVRLWPAFRRSIAGFLVGAVPILGVFFAFYQANLTRELTVEPQYQMMKQQVEEWLAKQRAVAPESNGMTELAPILYARKGEPKEATAIAERLNKGSDLYGASLPASDQNFVALDKASVDEARRAFLKELPRIERALAKPHFAPMARGEFSLQEDTPNYIVCRSVSQGLEGLVLESLKAGDSAKALDYLLTNLRWSRALREGNLINLMIGVAQTYIATESVERLVLEGNLDEKQLRRLLAGLQAAIPEPTLYHDTMMREAYLADKAFHQFVLADFSSLGEEEEGLAHRLLPNSYWQSERKTYLNFQLSQMAGWKDLARPPVDNMAELQPWSMAAQTLVPNMGRASVRFMASHSRLSAFRLVAALELYKLDHKTYPPDLEALVPSYIEALPVDAIHPNLWKRKPGFQYQVEGSGYRLLSDSPLYENISLHSRQSYGPDGDYEEKRAISSAR